MLSKLILLGFVKIRLYLSIDWSYTGMNFRWLFATFGLGEIELYWILGAPTLDVLLIGLKLNDCLLDSTCSPFLLISNPVSPTGLLLN